MNNPYIKSRHFSLTQFAITFIVLGTLTTGEMLILAEYINVDFLPYELVFGITGYWLIITVAFCILTHVQIRQRLENPMRMLGEAAKKVAGGDFSARLQPLHRPDKRDYMDAMFEDFNLMVEELGSIETLKTDFIADVSHEIKTPLSIIQNYVSALQEQDLSLDQRNLYLETIMDSSMKLSHCISNILKMNKLENQKIMMENQSYNLSRQLSECVIATEHLWEEKNLQFIMEIEDRCMIQCDANMLEIVWNNLISNAIKFTPPYGHITIHQSEDDHKIIVSIKDEGCGIDEAKVKHIFDKFYQAERSHQQMGNGLGLALCLKVIELLKGDITVQSHIHEGSTFTVKLPKF